MNGGFVSVAKYDELSEGRPTEVLVDQHEICLVRVGGKCYAFNNVCPHIGGRLSEGHVGRSGHISCPLHKAVFRIEGGESLSSFVRRGLKTFSVRVIDGIVQISTSESEENWREALPRARFDEWKILG